MKKYHPFLVALHWILVPLLMLALVMAGNVLVEIPNDSLEKIGALKSHMIMGLAIGGLMLIRLLTRLFSTKPAQTDGNGLLNKVAVLAHYVLYLLVFVMVVSGVSMSIQAGLPDIVFGGSGAALPESFAIYTPRIVHGIISKALFAMVVLHVVAALYHQFIVKDNLFSRMWFGQRK